MSRLIGNDDSSGLREALLTLIQDVSKIASNPERVSVSELRRRIAAAVARSLDIGI